MKALVSIIMPVYNTRAEYLDASIKSCVSQTYQSIELIIVNDGSCENHIDDIVNKYTDKLQINYIKLEPNAGAANARNQGIAHAKGQYIAFQDSDDVSKDTRIQKQVQFLESHPDIGMIGTECKTIPQGKVSVSPKTDADIKACALFFRCPALQSTVMVRKELLDKYNVRYRSEYTPAEDYAVWLDLLPYTQFAVLKDSLVDYRQHTGNISRTQADKQINICRKIVVDYWHTYLQLPEQSKLAIYNFLTYGPTTEEDFSMIEEAYQNLLDRISQAKFLNYDRSVFYLTKLHKKVIRKDRMHVLSKKTWVKRLDKIFPMGYLFRLQTAWKLL